MADLTTPQGVVDAGQQTFQHVENKLATAYDAVGKLRPVWAAGPGQYLLGQLEAAEIDAKIRVAQGKVAEAQAIVWSLHRRGTEIAIAAGLDLVQPASGGPR